MKILSSLFTFLTALIHLLFFKLESIDFMKPEVLERFNLNSESANFVEVWAFNQGFYNLFFAIGLLFVFVKVLKNQTSDVIVLANFIFLSIFGAGAVLYFSTPEKLIAALIQSTPALLGFVFINMNKKA